MARNTGSGFRRGSVRDREQIQTPGGYVKYQVSTGSIKGIKASPWKGVAQYQDMRRKK